MANAADQVDSNASLQPLLDELKELNKRLDRLENIPSLTRELKLLAAKDCANYIFENFPQVQVFKYRHETIDFAVKKMAVDGIITEFGVFKGSTINQIAKSAKDREIFGFDSFRGLPEDWGGTSITESQFDVAGKLPQVPDNVTLVEGWFSDSIPVWKKKVKDKIALCHVDSDLYSSAATIFTELEDRFQDGTILLFDEYFGYTDWRNGEHKAFMEMIERTGFGFDPLAVSHMGYVVRLNK